MTPDFRVLASGSPGSEHRIACFRYGLPGAEPKVYLQAGLHADEMPGVLALQHLMLLLDRAEAAGAIRGEILVVPLANPLGFSQWVQNKPQGRQDLGSMQNYNRGFPDLAALAGDDIAPHLNDNAAANTRLIRHAFTQALARQEAPNDGMALRLALMSWSHDADHVIDIHCDHHAVLHLYASNARPDVTKLLCRCMGAKLALIEDVSGGHAFDEAHTAPWVALRARFGDRAPIALPCFSTTLELRGQFDVDDATAGQDARNLMIFLAAVGALTGPASPDHADAEHLPLAGAIEAFAPQGGVVSWIAQPGDRVEKDQTIGHVTDPMTRTRLPLPAPATGLLFRTELWPSCLKGQGLAHVAGHERLRSGDLLSD